jgi:hypothetical protein
LIAVSILGVAYQQSPGVRAFFSPMMTALSPTTQVAATGIPLADPAYSGGSSSCLGSQPSYCLNTSWSNGNRNLNQLTPGTTTASGSTLLSVGEFYYPQTLTSPPEAVTAFNADATSAGTPWVAVVTSSSEASAMEQACKSGQMGQLPNNYPSYWTSNPYAGFTQYAPGVQNGVPVVSTFGTLPSWEVSNLEMGGGSTFYQNNSNFGWEAFQPNQTVVTCELP